MLNKKLLAVAVTAAMTQGIAYANPDQAAFDLDGATGDFPESTAVQYPTELTWGSDTAVVENKNGDTPSYFTSNVGFTIAEGTNKYIRIDLSEGATFKTAPRLVWDTVTAEKGRAVNDDNSDVQTYQLWDGSSIPVAGDSRPNPQSSIAEGGQGESFVVFEVNAFEEESDVREDIPRWLNFYVEVDQYLLPTDDCVSAQYRLYEDAIDAQRVNDETLKNTGVQDAMCFSSAVQNNFTIPNNAYASVDSEYTVFIHAGSEYADHDETNYYDEQQNGNDDNNNGSFPDFDGVGTWAGAAVSATTASVGEVDTDLLAPAGNGYTDLDGGEFNNVDVVGTDPVITFGGDFSFGAWSLARVSTPVATDSCDGGVETLPNGTLSTTSTLVFDSISQADIEEYDYVLCVDVEGMTSDVEDNLLVGMENPWEDGNRIGESPYTANISWDALTDISVIAEGEGWEEAMGAMPRSIDDTMGEIKYDSITVDVPYMSLFKDYKQRFHLTNTGPTPAKYMFDFTPEAGTIVDRFEPDETKEINGVQVQGKVSGIIPAGESIVIQVFEIIDKFEAGRSRTAAQLHIGGEDEDIGVSAVIVNSEKGTIDIQDLNANSIKARKSNFLPDANNVN